MSTEGQFVGHYHLYIGQEATGVAVMAALDKRDKLATTHRNHGHVLARGADPGRAMAEILGRATGLIGGRGGTIHLTEPDLGFISTSGIVGGCISLGVGAGYACRQRGDGSVAVPFFGDGALEEGVSFEALNIASLWRLPVVFMCENNSTGSWAPGEGYPTLVHASSDLCSIAQSLKISDGAGRRRRCGGGLCRGRRCGRALPRRRRAGVRRGDDPALAGQQSAVARARHRRDRHPHGDRRSVRRKASIATGSTSTTRSSGSAAPWRRRAATL